MGEQGRPRGGNWVQPRAQINRQVSGAEAGLRSSWEVSSQVQIRIRSSDGCQGQDPVE